MENLADYSNYVLAAYLVVSTLFGALFLITLFKYFNSKSRLKKQLNEK